MKNMVIIIGGAPVLAGLNREYDMNHRIWESQCAGVRASFKKKTSRKGKYEYTNWYREKSGGGLQSVGKEEPDYSKYYPPEPKPAHSFNAQEYSGHLILEQKDYEANQKLFKDSLVFKLEDCQNFGHPLYKNPEKALKEKGSAKYYGDEGYVSYGYENPEKHKDSVRKPGVSSGRSAISGGTETRGTIECHHERCTRYVFPGGDSTGWGNVDGKWYCETHYPLHSPVLHPAKNKEKDDMCRGDGDCDNCEHSDECPVSAEE